MGADTLSPDGIQARLEDLQKELIKKANNKQDYDAIADEIFRLRDQKEQSELDSHHCHNAYSNDNILHFRSSFFYCSIIETVNFANISSRSSPDIYFVATTTPTSNSATQHSDIYQGNSTLTLFEMTCPWISYRKAFILPNAKFARLPQNRSITGLSLLFFFDL